ncbi:hypothetical protein [Archangium lansingense]|uniref:Lipoprotein n=1 Tax=Archangium lansingense TaxID=2995310 RepID=A0ABT3ZV91_9BACT|nr:hypothetical protein [Archangium lansinium]MCY1073261.1 hypothetical protein [Archangium lansinium]
MKMSLKMALLSGLAACNLTACDPDDGNPDPDPTPTGERIEVSAKISADTTWTANNVYVLKDHIFVESGTLTIEAGTRIEGTGRSSLVVTTGGKLNAVGTKEKPIVFTAPTDAGKRLPGAWGGVVMLGKAPINVSSGNAQIEGFPATQPGIVYGGNDEAHNCGTLKYARIEFAGFKLTDNNELNGLTLGGCGTGTQVDYVQVHKGADDGVEMFGGTANLKHILITQPDDDGLDWDTGYRGKVQFLIVQQNADVGNMAFESDNNAQQAATAVPLSQPEVWNVTLIGSNADPTKAGKLQGGMHLKNGTGGKLNNVIIAHFADLAVDIDKTSTVTRYDNGELFIKNSIFWDNKNVADGNTLGADGTDNDGAFDEGSKLLESATGNRIADPMLTAALNLDAPNFAPKAGSSALDAAKAGSPTNDGFFDTTAKFVGAVGTEDWTAGWTAFPKE